MKNKVQLITYADRLGDGTIKSMTDILRTRFDGVYDGETELLVLCNLREREIAKPLPVGWTDAEKLLGNYPDTADTLRPYECVVLKK